VDPAQRARIRDDLRGIVRGDFLFDDLSRVLYSTDASIFQVQPLGAVVPRDEEDVQALVRYAAANGVPLVPRGAGSGLAGEALGDGLVVDLTRHFREVVDVGADQVCAQPGVVLRDLNERLAEQGRRFAPDPASADQCTLGGMLATNASGSRMLRHGYTRDHVVSLRIVLDTGEAVVAERRPRWPPADTQPGRLDDIVSSVATLLDANAELIRRSQPRTPFNRCGYLLDGVLSEAALDLPRLLVGSEGTLALFTEATLRTVPLPEGRSLVLLAFDSLEAALRAAQGALPTGMAACDLMDRRLLTLARGGDAETAALIPAAAEAILLVEYETDTEESARAAAVSLAERMHHAEGLARYALVAWEAADMERLWRVREAALPSLYGLRGGAQPIAFVEDVGVPPGQLAECLHGMQQILRRQETTASFLIHAATGQIHARPFLDLDDSRDAAKLGPLAEEIHGLVLDLGGTVSSQHGTGLARTAWVARQYGPLFPIFREVKAIFDPRQMFNPGKIVGPGIATSDWPLRSHAGVTLQVISAAYSAPSTETAAPVRQTFQTSAPSVPPSSPRPITPSPLYLVWRDGEMAAESRNCNGCGDCRTGVSSKRMCPIYRAEHTEAATPRAKANLMRHLLQEANLPLLPSDEVRAVADLCVNCKMCAVECPAHVNIPKLMLEAKAANVAQHGLGRTSWVLARTESFARVGGALAPLTNAILGSRGIRWLVEKLLGVSRQRRLPSFAFRSFLKRARRRGWTRRPRPGRARVAYFVDVFANYNDPTIAEAVVAVLHHNDVEVYVPPGQLGCGMAPLAHGDVELARETLQYNLRLLAEPAREGYAVLCSEPTAALLFRHDALDLLDDPDARLVAEHVVEATAYLGDLHRAGRLRTDFQPLELSLGHHVPCHLKALGRPPAGPGLLALIPGLRVRTIDVSCSGMAGTFGLQAENYATSLAAGQPMLAELARPDVRFGSTECSTCRLQMEDGARKRTLHPIQYLALAYGLLPDLGRRLHEPIRDLVLR
jgi:FAD/FMN-containing dehydrogenase/Fe-S oxidoreductase